MKKYLICTFCVVMFFSMSISAKAQSYTLKDGLGNDGLYYVGSDIHEGNYIVTSDKKNPYFSHVEIYDDKNGNGEGDFGERKDGFSVTDAGNEFFDESKCISEYRVSIKNGDLIEVSFGKAVFTENENAADTGAVSIDLENMSLEELNLLLQNVRREIAEKEQAAQAKSTPEPSYGTLNYARLARIPENFIGQKIQFKGTVLQVQGSRREGYDIRIATSENGFDDVIYLYAGPDSLQNMNILDGDRLEVKGEIQGDYAYTTVMGNEITLPLVFADKVSIIIYESNK